MRQDALSSYWQELNGKKGDLLKRCEQYARWTVPSVFPEDVRGTEQGEAARGNVAIGARLVNHLAHRIVDTMFPNDKPFFAISLTPEAKAKLDAEVEQAQETTALTIMDEALRAAEDKAMRNLNLTAYRPIAVSAVILQIVTGNALIFRFDDGSRTVYSVRDYAVVREINGRLREVILRDAKTFGSLDDEHQQALQAKAGKTFSNADDVEMFTYFERQTDGRWGMRQSLNDLDLEEEHYYAEKDFPCLVLTWNLSRGDNYGRGLVEDYAVSFHNVDVLTEAMIDMIGIAADVKFLVNDTSTFDVDAWNQADRGDYVPGKEGDITVPQFKFAVELNVLAEAVGKLERELAQAFLLSSAGVRDAERVTAEEIRFFAREIESAFGGLYSRLALDWQKKEAEYQLSQIKFSATLEDGSQVFDTTVVTGLESLSREGKLDNLRLAIADLQMLEAVPPEVRAAFNPVKFANFIFNNRGVPAKEFLFTATEMQANQEAAQKREQELLQGQAESKIAAASA